MKKKSHKHELSSRFQQTRGIAHSDSDLKNMTEIELVCGI